MKSELILASSEVEDLAVCVDCGLQECMDCPRNKVKQKLKEAARDKGDVSNGIAPAVYATTVVRCRECKHRKYDDIFGIMWCNLDSCKKRVKLNDFCSYGERKEGYNDGIHN